VTLSDLPALNASLNAVSAVFLTAGYRQIRHKKIAAHRACMLAAFTASTLFLISYLIYHSQVGTTRFLRQGWIRPVYFTILSTHVVLAAAILPLAVITLNRALHERFDKHRRIARWTLPLWMYVSVTGVLVYLILYQM
jgi:uncharacterized membrane protein YozB (DUF420 family)